MTGTIKKFLLSASVIAGAGAIATSPASAINITSATLTGSAPTDFEVWDVGGTPGIDCPPTATSCLKSSGTNVSNLINVLDGTLASPGGNIELFKSSETLGLNAFKAYDKVTSLKTDFSDGTSVTFSSLTAKDLFGAGLDTSYGANTLATTWFDDAFEANLPSVLTAFGVGNEAALYTKLNQSIALANLLLPPNLKINPADYTSRAALYNGFLNKGGFQRAVDPNIAFVNKIGNNVEYGLAGHANLLFYAPQAVQAILAQKGVTVQGSELIKLSYSGQDRISYSFGCTPSNVASKDGSFNCTYAGDPAIVPPPTEKVPEPSVILGLLGVSGMFVATRKLKKS